MSPSDFFLGTKKRLDASSILLLNQRKKVSAMFKGLFRFCLFCHLSPDGKPVISTSCLNLKKKDTVLCFDFKKRYG
jgi:hypothetical protein